MEDNTLTKTQTKMELFLNGEFQKLTYLEYYDEDYAVEISGTCIPVKKVLTLALCDNMHRFAGSMEKEEAANKFLELIFNLDQKVDFILLRELYWLIESIDPYSSYSTDIIETDLSGVTDDRVWNMIKFTQSQIDRSAQIALKKIEKIINSKYVSIREER